MTNNVTDTNVGKMTFEEAIRELELAMSQAENSLRHFARDNQLRGRVEALNMAIEALRNYQKAIADLTVICKRGADPCICCKYLENKGDQFPCRYGEWCCGETWDWRD